MSFACIVFNITVIYYYGSAGSIISAADINSMGKHYMRKISVNGGNFRLNGSGVRLVDYLSVETAHFDYLLDLIY